MEEKLLEVYKVTPPPCSPRDDIVLPFTFFDLFNSVFAPVEHLLFYETSSPHSHHVLVSNLKLSLSLTLAHFLPVAGNLVWPVSSPKPFIHYQSGDGVLLIVTRSDDDFYSLSSEKYRECRKFQPLVAQIVRSGNQVPLLAFKVTIFAKGGICIGFTTNHSIFDGRSAMLFLNTWASFTKFGNNHGLGEECIPVLDGKSVTERYPELENSFLGILKQKEVRSGELWSVPGPIRPVGMIRGTFVLSDSDLSLLKGLVIGRLVGSSKQKVYVSTFAIVFAYVILCLVQASPPKNKRINVSFHFDCRDRLEPRLPRNYFGNCVGVCYKYFNTDELSGWDGMVIFVNFIREATQDLENSGALKHAKEWIPNTIETDNDKESLIVSVYGSTKFELQNVDFGWGRPRKADIASIDGVRGIYFARREDIEGGIKVELSLDEGEMKNFARLFDRSLASLKRPINASL